MAVPSAMGLRPMRSARNAPAIVARMSTTIAMIVTMSISVVVKPTTLVP